MAAIFRFKQSRNKRLSFKTRESLRAEEADMVSKLISGPSNFSHLQHMGPGDGLEILKDPSLVRTVLRLCFYYAHSIVCRGVGGLTEQYGGVFESIKQYNVIIQPLSSFLTFTVQTIIISRGQ